MWQVSRMLMRRLDWLVWDISPVTSAPGETEERFTVRVRIRRWHPGYWLYVLWHAGDAWRRAV